jgi:hypothetical protein
MRVHDSLVRCLHLGPTKALHRLPFEQLVGRKKMLNFARNMRGQVLQHLGRRIYRVPHCHTQDFIIPPFLILHL